VKRKTNEELIALGKEYGVEVRIPEPPVVPKSEVILLRGVKRPELPPEKKP
jgi:hypothetical protein